MVLDAVVGSDMAVNHNDTQKIINLRVDGSWSKTTGYSSSVTPGMKISTSFPIEGFSQMLSVFSVSLTTESSHTSSVLKTPSATVTVTVSPRSKIKVDMIAVIKKKTSVLKYQSI